MEATLLTLGVILIVVGLVGQVKAKEIEVGTKSPVVRIILGLIGAVFVSMALKLPLPFLPATGTETLAPATTQVPAPTTPAPPATTQAPPATTQAPPVTTEAPPCIPSPSSPETGAVLDNGRTDRSDSIIWDFAWAGCPGAIAYELYVIHTGASTPVVDAIVTNTAYHHTSEGSYIADANRFDWTWKVRSQTGGQWGDWSPARSFVVEPVNTDPAPAGSVPDYVHQVSYTGDCANRPSGSTCVGFSDTFTWLVYDSIVGWKDGDPWQGKNVQIAQGSRCDYYHVLTTDLVMQACH